jgi:hypothetical protein
VRVQIVEEANGHHVADGDALVCGQQQEGQPGHQREPSDAADQEVEGRSGRTHTEPEMVERPAEHRRKVDRFRPERRQDERLRPRAPAAGVPMTLASRPRTLEPRWSP